MADDISKKDYKTIGDAIGMPDYIDKLNLRKIISGYEKEFPGEIKIFMQFAKANSRAFENEFGIINKNSGMRYILELPPMLHAQIESYMPTVWRERKHFRWFCKQFPELVIPDKL